MFLSIMQQKQQLLLLGLLAVLTASASVHGQSTVGLQLVGFSQPDAAIGAADKVAFDDQQNVVYVAGGSQLSALDASADVIPNLTTSSSTAAAALPLLTQQQLPAAVADVAVCGGLLAVAAEGVEGKAAPGQLLLYRAYDKSKAAAAAATDGSADEAHGLTLMANITVGPSPVDVQFSKDCQTLLLASRGAGSAGCTAAESEDCTDIAGSVSVVIIRYCPDPSNMAACGESRLRYKVLSAGFAAWDDQRKALVSAGMVLPADGAAAAQAVSVGLVPEHIAFSEDESIAFVTLKENSAVAVLHVASARITGIFPLAAQQQPAAGSSRALLAAAAGGQALLPEAVSAFSDKDIDYLVIVSGSSFSILRADYEPPAAAAAASGQAQPLLPSSPRKGLEQRVAQLTTVFDSATQLTSIAGDANIAAAAEGAATAGVASVAVGECPGEAAAAAAARRCAFVAVRAISAVFVYDIRDPAAPAFQSLSVLPKSSAEEGATPFDAQAGLAYSRYKQQDGGASVPVLLVGYAGQAGGLHGLRLYRVAAQ